MTGAEVARLAVERCNAAGHTIDGFAYAVACVECIRSIVEYGGPADGVIHDSATCRVCANIRLNATRRVSARRF